MGSLAQGITAIGVLVAGFFAVVVFPVWNMGAKAARTMELVETMSSELHDPTTGETLRTQIDRMESAQRVMGDELSRMASRISLYVEDAQYGVFICDGVGRNIEVNRTYARMLAVGKGDLLGYGWRNHVMPEELPSYDDQWRSAFEEQRELPPTRVTFRRADTGRLLTARVMIYPFFEQTDASLFMGRIEWEEGT